jgi:hypothetical protein
MQKFAGALLLLDCIHGQGQRLLVLTKVHKSRGQIAGKIYIQHLVTLGVKLLQRSLQQLDSIDAIVLKKRPLTLQASRYGAIRYQRVRGGEITQFIDAVIRLPQVRHGQKDRKDQGQGSAQRGGVA